MFPETVFSGMNKSNKANTHEFDRMLYPKTIYTYVHIDIRALYIPFQLTDTHYHAPVLSIKYIKYTCNSYEAAAAVPPFVCFLVLLVLGFA